jgi:hypothetical protein
MKGEEAKLQGFKGDIPLIDDKKALGKLIAM